MSTVAANKLSNVSKTKQIDVDALIDKANDAMPIVDLADPAVGSSKVGALTPKGLASTVGAEMQANDKEYSRSAFSTTIGAIQSGPLIVDASRYLKITGSRADAAYNNDVVQNILSGLPHGAEIEFPARGQAYLTGGLVIDSASVNLRGKNSAIAYDQFGMQFTDTSKPAFTVKNSGLTASGLLFIGDVPGRALNSTQDIFDFDVTLNNGHIDSRINDCGFLYVRAAASITKSSGRNLAFRNCSFSNSQYAFALEYDTAPNDQRMFEFYNCRYHTMGRLLSSTDSVFYIKPTAQALSLIVNGGHVDDSVRVVRGFAGMSSINSLLSSRAAGQFADIDSTGHTLTGYRQFNIESCGIMNINTTTHSLSAIKAQGSMALYIDGFTSGGSGGHGLEIRSSYADIRATTIHNASMGATDTYSGFYIGPEASAVTFGAGCAYKQSREVSAGGTTAKFGVENLGTGTIFQDRLVIDNLTSPKGYYIDPLKTSRGPDPVVPGSLHRITWGSAAPTTGTWTLGDRCINISSSGSNDEWRCTVGGSPGTWISI